MSRVQPILIAGASALLCAVIGLSWSSSAEAADYSPPCVPPPQCYQSTPPSIGSPVPQCLNPPGPLCAMPPQPVYQPVPVPVVEEFGSNWYLRGDIGLSTQKAASLFNVLYNNPGVSVQGVGFNFDSAPTFGVGLGYQFNPWLRFDVTTEYRSKANFKGSDLVRFPDLGGTAILADNYTFSKSEWVLMANAYFDFGTWWCITPFVGAGVGFSYNTIHGFRDDGLGFRGDGTPIISVATGEDASMWNFAWALHAGLSYKASQNLSIEFAYRYMGLGDALSGDLVNMDGTNNVNNPMHVRGLTSHDFKLGIRWSLDGGYGVAQAPSVRPAPAYYPPPPPPVQQQQLYIPPSPPPVYQQQPIYAPLQRRG